MLRLFFANELKGKEKLGRSRRSEGWEDRETAYSNTHNAALEEDAKVCGQEIWKAIVIVVVGEPNSKVWVRAANTHEGITLLARSIHNLHAYNLPNAAYVISYINMFIKL